MGKSACRRAGANLTWVRRYTRVVHPPVRKRRTLAGRYTYFCELSIHTEKLDPKSDLISGHILFHRLSSVVRKTGDERGIYIHSPL